MKLVRNLVLLGLLATWPVVKPQSLMAQGCPSGYCALLNASKQTLSISDSAVDIWYRCVAGSWFTWAYWDCGS